tara:strand:- start:1940 stop:2089 length:150 start_codon:yes stop_codon:yes gene_type:complete
MVFVSDVMHDVSSVGWFGWLPLYYTKGGVELHAFTWDRVEQNRSPFFPL